MKIKIIIILLFALGVLDSLHAQQATQTEVTNAAINTMMYESNLGLYYSTDSVANIYTKSVNGNVVLYEVHFTNGSSVLLSGSKSFIPVLAVLSSETDDPTTGLLNNYSDIPDVLKDIIDTYAETIDSIFNSVTTNDYLYEWNALQQYDPNTYKSSANSVGPLLTTKWGPDKPNNNKNTDAYNYYVTETSYNCGGEKAAKCPAGCVAVAMAQIMRYWLYPQVIPYKCSQYGWSLMPNKLKTTDSYYAFYRMAVSRLIQDCAASVDMDYCAFGFCQSLARDDSVYIALKHFGYGDAQYKEKKNYTSAVWEAMIRQDLDNGYPIFYGGNKANSGPGHAFVCDGYKKNTYNNEYKYHFNYGNLGKGDGWFIICRQTLFHTFEFFHNQAATFNCYPTNCWGSIIMECDKTYSAGFSETYSADSVFNNAGHNYVINSGANINLTAGHEIYLSNGFYVAEGSSFTATIAPCGGAKGIDEEGDIISQNFQDSIPTTKSLQHVAETPSGVSVYPNPVTGTLHITLLNPEETVKQVVVTSLLGNIVLQQDNLPDGTINTTPLANGMYIARICTADGKIYHAKFVKK